MTMRESIAGRNRGYLRWIAFCLLVQVVGCNSGEGVAGEYRESRGQVIEVQVRPADERISLTPFVRVRNGRVELPRLYYLQKHFTPIGVRDVEKGGRMSVVAAPYRKAIKLPASEDIEEFYFLAAGPSLVQAVQAGKETIVTKWIPSGLLKISAKDVAADKALIVPALTELEDAAEKDKLLFQRLCKELERARDEAEERGKIPVTSDTKVPWWAQ